MDPAGIREILLVRPYDNNPYQFEPLVRELPYKARVNQTHFSSMPWLPLFPPLPGRVSATGEALAGYLQHDCLILAGSDLESCRERDVENIHSAVERGLPLLLCGGRYGLGHTYRRWHDFAGLLPAGIPAAKACACDGEVTACGTHPILRGLPATFGRVDALHPIEPAPNAQVILSANGMPVMVAGESSGGRQLILAVAAASGLCCDGLDTEGFYGHPAYADLMRRALSWLMGIETSLWFESLDMATGWRLQEPGQHHFQVTARQQGDNPGALLRCSVYGVDEARLISGGDTVRADKLVEQVYPMSGSSLQQTITLEDPLGGQGCGLYEVELRLEMDNPPNIVSARDAFGMSRPPHWNSWRDNAVDVRRLRLRFPDARRARVTVPGWLGTLEEGKTWSLQVEPRDAATPQLAIHDAHGQEVGRVCGSNTAELQELSWQAPPLVEGEYTARLTVGEETFVFALRAVAPPAPSDTFQMVAHFPGSPTNEAELHQRLHDCREAFGLDTISLGGLSYAEGLWDTSIAALDRPYAQRRTRWLDALVAAHGQNLWTDFDKHLLLLKTHGASKTYDPTTPCVHDPGYEQAVRAQIAPLLRYMRTRAGLISTEIIDEPHLYGSNLCHCEICKRLYRERFSEEMPAWDEVIGDKTSRRWHLFQWLEDYTTRAFAATWKVKQELAPEVHIHNVSIDRLFSSNNIFNAMPRWAKYGDELYMACYPWSYAAWRCWKQAPHSQTHWIAAWMRGIATHYDIPWGVFMELWEEDVPDRWMPPYWPVGQFYALLAAGVTRLDTFLICFTEEMFGISDARLREFGAEVKKVRPFFPLLSRTKRPRARMAFLNPWCDWVMNPQPYAMPPEHEGYGYYRGYAMPFDKWYPFENRRMLAYELFQRTFSDLDQADEQLLCEETLDHQAIVISDAAFLMRQTMEKLTAFVHDGGVLILDCGPAYDESGQETDFYRRLTAGTPARTGIIIPGLSYRVFEVGQGKVLAFSASLQTTYGDVLEAERPGLRERLEGGVRGLLRELGLVSRCETDCGDLDAGARFTENVCLVPVANTGPDARTGRVTLRDLPFAPTCAANLTDGGFIKLTHGHDGLAFDVALDGYHGALFALFALQPDQCAVRVIEPNLRPGDLLQYEVTLGVGDAQTAGVTFQVDVQVTDSRGEIHPRLGRALIVTDGVARFEKRLPINAPTGKWTINAQDSLVGLTGETTFTVEG